MSVSTTSTTAAANAASETKGSEVALRLLSIDKLGQFAARIKEDQTKISKWESSQKEIFEDFNVNVFFYLLFCAVFLYIV